MSATAVAPPAFGDGRADCIYFLMYDSWPWEMRSNRWHYASRWARHLPVVLVQPVLMKDDEPSVSLPEPRIPNARILKVRAAYPPICSLTTGMLQAKQLHEDMAAHGYSRPILWTYNPDYLFASEILPASMRVFHATENYFYFERLTKGFIERLKRLLAISDLVIGVSEGVVASHRPFAKDVATAVTNGCDFAFYNTRERDATVVRLGEGWEKTAVYAGNINNRLDFELLDAAAAANPTTNFVFFGPISGIADTPDAEGWKLLVSRKNVSYQGAVDVEQLPGIFAAAHVGLIPYKSDPILVDNTFPLKAFEMQSAGLPVVSTDLSALRTEAGPGLLIASGRDAFIDGVRRLDRRVLGDNDQLIMRQQCLAHDYDRKFDAVFELVTSHLKRDLGISAPGLELRGLASAMQSSEELARLYAPIAPNAPRQVSIHSPLAKWVSRIEEGIINGVRSKVPRPVKSILKKILKVSP
ncbi:glycosyltransferase [Bradyrhizobium sp. OAE829]|uniref:glycosyltransferase n=1 Tax=Bradyrhizobium sp. OAE829 TaxID=2663807 RepID=UPI001789F05E